MEEPQRYEYPLSFASSDNDDPEEELHSLLRETSEEHGRSRNSSRRQMNGSKKKKKLSAVWGVPSVVLPSPSGKERASLFVRKRQNVVQITPRKSVDGPSSHFWKRLGFVRGNLGSSFWTRNFLGLFILTLVLIGLLLFNYKMVLQQTVSQQAKLHPTFDQRSPASSSFTSNGQMFTPISDHDIPVSNVGHAVPSLSSENLINQNGLYLHNPFFSPFASSKYVSDIAPEDRQQTWENRRQQTIEKFGQWNDPVTDKPLISPQSQYFAVPYRDVASFAWEPNSWQLDRDFQAKLVQERLALVQRVLEGIYAEYGWGDESNMTQEQISDRERRFGVIVHEFGVLDGEAVDGHTRERLPGVAFLGKSAWNGLIRKLLHSMMTQDDFYVVAVGSEALYGGHNLLQTQVMQFNYIMEPVLDLMGIKLISRNMGMNATTTVSALGGADIYGEADILWVVPDGRPGAVAENNGQFDLLQKQAILSGERMPLILTPNPVELNRQSNNTAWLGNLQPGNDVCDVTEKNRIPTFPACQFLKCSESAQMSGMCDKFRSVCWVDRDDIRRNEIPAQMKDLGVLQGFPNFRQHQWEGRKLSLLVLHALKQALLVWEKELQKSNGVPLKDSLWHVGAVYEKLRDSIRTLKKSRNEEPSACERLLRNLDPDICHMSMHALTDWTPRVKPKEKGLASKLLSPFVDANKAFTELYHGVDLLPLQWEIKENEVDVHMIAIAAPNTTDADGFDVESLFRGYDSLSEDFSSDGDSYSDDDFYDDDFYGSTRGRRHRHLEDKPTTKWRLINAPLGFCDGSAQSQCNRKVIGNECLLANRNHYQAALRGSGHGGQVSFRVSIKEGVVLLRFEWKEESPPISLPDLSEWLPKDLIFEYHLNNGETTSLDLESFLDRNVQLAEDLIVFPLLLDRQMSHTDDIEDMTVSFWFRTAHIDDFAVLLTHVYYA